MLKDPRIVEGTTFRMRYHDALGGVCSDPYQMVEIELGQPWTWEEWWVLPWWQVRYRWRYDSPGRDEHWNQRFCETRTMLTWMDYYLPGGRYYRPEA